MSKNIFRPKIIDQFIGQDHIISSLKILISASLIKKSSVGHVLFHGGPGLGKTSLAEVISNAMSSNIVNISAPVLKKPKDIIGIVNSLNDNDVLFIDEIHRLDKVVQEYLYTIMEDFCIDIIDGKESGSVCYRIPTANFTLVGATTRIDMISSPLLSRFKHIFKLMEYEDSEMKELITRSCKLLNIKLHDDAIDIIVGVSRGTPRLANNHLSWIHDWITAHNINTVITKNIVNDAFKKRIDVLGLTTAEISIMSFLFKNKGPAGVKHISSVCDESIRAIEEMYEPFLIKKGFIRKTSRGRCITDLGVQFLQKYCGI